MIGRLVHEGVAGHHHAVHRDTSAGLDQHHVAHLDLGGADLLRAALTPDDRVAGQEVEQVFDGPPPPAHGQPLQHLGHEDEEDDHETR